ncbi:uncharacterized protein VP01_8763g1, partial [Puccinia sorghi]
IIFMLSNLSGNATKWAQPLNQWVLNESDPDVTPPTLAKFITSFNGYFLDPERKGKAQKALRTFKKYSNQQYPGEPLLWRIDPTRNHPTTATLSKSAHQHSTTATNPNAMDLLAMNGCFSDSEHLVIYLETAQKRRTPANLPDPSTLLTYRC